MNRVHLLLLFLFALLATVVPSAVGASGGVVVSQIYGGGGNAGASYANDFVELFNPGASSVDLTGWSIQYASAASTSWQPTALSGSIGPGRSYLVQLASTAAVGAALPAPDATGTTNLAASGGKVALVADTTALTCGASAGSCAASAAIRDLVGYGSAADYEGSGAAPALSSTTAAERAAAGCTDTGDNAADFASVAPATSQLRRRPRRAVPGRRRPPAEPRRRLRSTSTSSRCSRSASSARASASGRCGAGRRRHRFRRRSPSQATSLRAIRSTFTARRLPRPICRSGSPQRRRPAARSGRGSRAVRARLCRSLRPPTWCSGRPRGRVLRPGMSGPPPSASRGRCRRCPAGRYSAAVTFTVLSR